mmetsp:Transcript_19289/g.25138  ORF Transcript_19289/g.25138 Transcript_19289/m.25138 type:complete len:429 (-) Transcript_19289:747-2033(-)
MSAKKSDPLAAGKQQVLYNKKLYTKYRSSKKLERHYFYEGKEKKDKENQKKLQLSWKETKEYLENKTLVVISAENSHTSESKTAKTERKMGRPRENLEESSEIGPIASEKKGDTSQKNVTEAENKMDIKEKGGKNNEKAKDPKDQEERHTIKTTPSKDGKAKEPRESGTKSKRRIPTEAIAGVFIALVLAVIVVYLPMNKKIIDRWNAKTEKVCSWDTESAEKFVLQSELSSFLTKEHAHDHGSLLQIFGAFGDDLTFDWSQNEDQLDAPEPHAVSLRLEGNNAEELRKMRMEYLQAALGNSCYSQSVLVLDEESLFGSTPSKMKDIINKHIQRTKNLGVLSLIVLTEVEKIQNIEQLKNYIDSDRIVVNKTNSMSVSHEGVGFIFESATLPKGENCSSFDTLTNDEKVLAWKRSLLGRITYRTRLCL